MTQEEDLSVRVGLTEAQYRRSLARIEASTQRAAKKAETRFKTANRSMQRGFDRSSRSASSFANGGMRNVSMQLSQVAQQGAATGDYLRALSIQLPDLALGFGTLGIAIGAAGGVLAPFLIDLVRGGEEGRELGDIVGDLSQTVDDYAAAAKRAQTPTRELRDEYGDLADEAERLFDAQLQLERLELASTITESQSALRDMFGDVADVPEQYARNYARAVREIEELNQPRLNAQGVDTRSGAELRAANDQIEILQGIVDRVRPAIVRIKDELDVTDEAASDLLATLVRFSEAATLDEQYSALQEFQALYLRSVEAAGGLTDETRETANAIDAALEALFNLLQVQDETTDATGRTADEGERVAAALNNIDLSGALSQVEAFLEYLQSSGDEAERIARNLDAARRSDFERRLDRENPDFFDPRGEGDAGRLPSSVVPDLPSRPDPAAASSGGSGGGGGGARRAVDPLAAGRETAEQLRQDMQLLGQSAQRVAELRTKWAALAAAKRAGIPITEELRGRIEAQAAEVGRLTGELEQNREAQDQLDQAIDDVAGSLADALLEAEGWREGMANVFQSLARDILKSGIRGALDHVLNVQAGGGGGGGILGGLASVLFGRRGAGGNVREGRVYEVGENGRELFAPGESGTIINAAQTQRLTNATAGGGAGGRSEILIRLADGLRAEILEQAGEQAVQIVSATGQAQRRNFGAQVQQYQDRGTSG